MRREDRHRKPTEAQVRERYQGEYQRYISGEFTYNSHILLKRICEEGEKEPHMYGIPLYKIALQVVKLAMMNELEIMFLGSTLQEMKWKVADPCLNEYFEEAVDFTPQVPKDQMGRKVQLGLLLIAFIVKIYLNEDNSLVDFKVREVVRANFDKMYQTWVQKVQTHFKFNPKNMNRLFREFASKNATDRNIQIVDYNKLVADFLCKNEGYQPEDRPDFTPTHPVKTEPSVPYQMKPAPAEDLPMEEEVGVHFTRRESGRLHRLESGILFQKKESGNEFFPPRNFYRGTSFEE